MNMNSRFMKLVNINLSVGKRVIKLSDHVSTKLRAILLGCLYGLVIVQPVQAEDIEIYVRNSSVDPSIRPNVLFLLDTSKSMGVEVTSSGPYIATEDYSDASKYPPPAGIPACFDPDRVYRLRFGSGRATEMAVKYCQAGIFENKDYLRGYAEISNFFCKSAKMIDQNGGSPVEASDSSGYYTSKVAVYRPNWANSDNRWFPMTYGNTNQAVECQADYGKHGRVAGDSRKYPTIRKNKSGNNRWTSNEADAINWANVKNSSVTYTGNYLNYLIAAPDTATYRIRVIRDVMVPFINSIDGINLGFMPYSYNLITNRNVSEGGMVEVPIGKVEDVREDIIKRLKSYAVKHKTPTGSWFNDFRNLVLGTPSSRQYYEALRYFKGEAPVYGATSKAPSYQVSDDCTNSPSGLCQDATPGGTVTPTDIVSFPSVSGALDADGTYKSPVEKECQANFIILLTDGEPYADPISKSQLTDVGISDFSCVDDPTCVTGNCQSSCLAKFAEAGALLNKNDTLSSIQPIMTYTIAFNANVPILKEATDISRSITGKGESFKATNANELADRLRTIIDALKVNTTFSSPAVSINAFNRAVHLDDLYFTLFKPGKGPHWDGNFKKFKIAVKTDANGDPVYDADGRKIPVIVDANGNEAIDPDSGYFYDNARSFWSINPDTGSALDDGGEVTSGGAVSQLKVNRQVYTFTGSYNNSGHASRPSSKTVKTAVNVVSSGNVTNITAAMLGIGASDTVQDGAGNTVLLHKALLERARGVDIFNEDQYKNIDDRLFIMGDPLHAQPAIVQYGAAANDLIAFVATNDGYLHAFDTSTGEELWAFIPQELLSLLNINYENIDGDPKSYGLDGNVVAWIDDKDGNGTVDGSDRVMLYVTQRRGGNRIYAFDVTDRNNPKYEWMIEGGIPGNAYENLGQTWSTINVAQVKDGTGVKNVLIFGGGYDTNKDNDGPLSIMRTPDSVGNSVYIADAETGDLLWSAGLTGNLVIPEMKYSIPARIKPLDMSGDGNIDRLYAADTGGQIFRFDIDETTNSFSPADISGGRIAEFAADNSAADARRFYYPPDVALIARRGKPAYLAVSIASGFRAHPNNTMIHDRIYIFKDWDVYRKPASYNTLRESDLYDATLNYASQQDGSEAQTEAARADLESKDGWYIILDDEQTPPGFIGEKGMSETLIVENTLLVTTFLPQSATAGGGNACAPQEGSGRIYYLDIFDATPANHDNFDIRPNRYVELKKAGIPPGPNLVITEDRVPTMCVGTECSSLGGIVGARRTFWNEVEK